jgi:hypothetical protein
LDLTIAGMIVTKVLIDGGVWLNIIFSDTLRKMGLEFTGMITLISVPFYEIVPSKAAMPLGQITLSVTFGTPTNYRTEVHQIQSSRLLIIISCYPWATSVGQIHGNTTLSIPIA